MALRKICCEVVGIQPRPSFDFRQISFVVDQNIDRRLDKPRILKEHWQRRFSRSSLKC